MRYADSKDIKRAKELGIHSGAVHINALGIARGKAGSMAKAITDRRKILGRLEAVASVWDDFEVLLPFIKRCVEIWPNSQYEFAFNRGKKLGTYSRLTAKSLGISRDYLLKKEFITNPSGKLMTGEPYEFDEVGIIIFNTTFKGYLKF